MASICQGLGQLGVDALVVNVERVNIGRLNTVNCHIVYKTV